MLFSRSIKSIAEKKSLTQKVTCMSLGSIVPPMEDCEIFSKVPKNEMPEEPVLNGDSDSECSRASESEDEENAENTDQNAVKKVNKGNDEA